MTIGIIGALDEEIEYLTSVMENTKEEKIGPFVFYTGKLDNKNLVVSISGIGKVCAGSCASIMIHSFHANYVINTGAAGGINAALDIGDIVFSSKVAYHDVDVTAFNYKKGQLPKHELYFKADNNLIAKAKEAIGKINFPHKCYTGTILSGDVFVANKNLCLNLAKNFDDVWAVEMEGAAIGQVCSDFKVPFLVVRAMSDRADGNACSSYDDFSKEVAQYSAKFVQELIKLL